MLMELLSAVMFRAGPTLLQMMRCQYWVSAEYVHEHRIILYQSYFYQFFQDEI
jgi:hypothetical protein